MTVNKNWKDQKTLTIFLHCTCIIEYQKLPIESEFSSTKSRGQETNKRLFGCCFSIFFWLLQYQILAIDKQVIPIIQ